MARTTADAGLRRNRLMRMSVPVLGLAAVLMGMTTPLMALSSGSSSSPSLEEFARFYRRGEPAISRSVLCTISPFSEEIALDQANLNLGALLVWNDRPLFVAEPNITLDRVLVFQDNVPSPQWMPEELPPNVGRVRYAGAQLQPGQTYKAKLWGTRVDSTGRPLTNSKGEPLTVETQIQFTLVDATQRQAIAQQLQALDSRNQQAGISPEARAITRAYFFAENQLLYDGLQELYSIENPSPEVQSLIQQLSAELCSLRG